MVACLLLWAAATGPIQAAPIVGINFVGKESSSGSAMAATETAGLEPQSHWNNASSGCSTEPLALVDSLGQATGLTATWRGSGTYNAAIANTPGSLRLMRGCITQLGTDPATVTVSDLSAAFPAGCNVIVYFDGANGLSTWVADYTIGTTTLTGRDLAGATFSGTFVRDTGAGGNYLCFENVQGNTFTLSALPRADGVSAAAINAIQITHAPEPATVGLVAAGLTAFFLRRRARC
jgi:hypothetical protein